MKAIASRDEVALDLVLAPAVTKADGRRLHQIVHRHVVGFEVQRAPGRDARVDQIANDLVLSVDRDALATRQLGEVDAMPAAVETDVDAGVPKASTPHASAHTHRRHE